MNTWKEKSKKQIQRLLKPRNQLRIVAWGIALYGLSVPSIRLVAGYDPIAFPLILAATLLAILFVVPRKYNLRTWIFYVGGLYFFTQLRDAADETSISTYTNYVLDWELWMFNGTTPTAWLQMNVGGDKGDPGFLAFLATFTHWTWFIFPHTVVIATFFFARPLFFRTAAIVIGTFFFAVALYYLVPTAPPWMAAEQGLTSGARRIMEDVGPLLLGQGSWDSVFEFGAAPNLNAAMPSLHFAGGFVVVILAFILRSKPLGAIAIIYSTLLCFSLMYLAEHYFIDILAGGLIAIISTVFVETILGNGLIGRWIRRIHAQITNRWRKNESALERLS